MPRAASEQAVTKNLSRPRSVRETMRPLAGAMLVLLLAPLALPTMGPALASGDPAPGEPERPAGVVHHNATLPGGAKAHGLLVQLPESAQPDTLVVILHGYNHHAESHRAYLETLAARGVLGLAMDYRGPKDGFPLQAGADDTVAAVQETLAANPSVDRVILYSVSMGTAVSPMVITALPGVFDAWVIGEGLSMLAETWAGATALKPSGNPTAIRAAQAIEDETGGTPATAAPEYVKRSAALRVGEYAGFEEGVILTHGLNDGLVPYDQGREMVAALRTHGFKADFHTVVRGEPGQEGTTLTGYVPTGQGGFGLAGHGTESVRSHTLTGLTLALLDRLVDGDATVRAADREFVLDNGATLLH